LRCGQLCLQARPALQESGSFYAKTISVLRAEVRV
jgi:hypothetical protein